MNEAIERLESTRVYLIDDDEFERAQEIRAVRVKLVHVKLFLEMVQDKETAPSAEWVANRAKELLA
jgi:hypothetical protein